MEELELVTVIMNLLLVKTGQLELISELIGQIPVKSFSAKVAIDKDKNHARQKCP